ncbi:hypothetical protein H696_04568 [Fonticula alba]|uniref:Adenylate cyclase n=1 Tax=Fonticula alba TaxID=691883 RepID=A0A058Z4D7_FONAL|nr:hypothetical protein H696_04568 [Fonticula alba]KCV69154.1 hypothetical protein H696_04568 [Fonticula alba]|eukprot:XP_009496725.1 hypothetical protein H696_04568 [Fonticula alba]
MVLTPVGPTNAPHGTTLAADPKRRSYIAASASAAPFWPPTQPNVGRSRRPKANRDGANRDNEDDDDDEDDEDDEDDDDDTHVNGSNSVESLPFVGGSGAEDSLGGPGNPTARRGSIQAADALLLGPRPTYRRLPEEPLQMDSLFPSMRSPPAPVAGREDLGTRRSVSLAGSPALGPQHPSTGPPAPSDPRFQHYFSQTPEQQRAMLAAASSVVACNETDPALPSDPMVLLGQHREQQALIQQARIRRAATVRGPPSSGATGNMWPGGSLASPTAPGTAGPPGERGPLADHPDADRVPAGGPGAAGPGPGILPHSPSVDSNLSASASTKGGSTAALSGAAGSGHMSRLLHSRSTSGASPGRHGDATGAQHPDTGSAGAGPPHAVDALSTGGEPSWPRGLASGPNFPWHELVDLVQTHRGALDLSSNALVELPHIIGKMTALKDLFLGDNLLQDLPRSADRLTRLRRVELNNNRLKDLPVGLRRLTQLRRLNLGDNFIQSLTHEINRLTSLEELYLYNNFMVHLPPTLARLECLTILSVVNNALADLPPDFGQYMPHLNQLYLASNQLKQLPSSIGSCKSLIVLRAENNKIESIPPEFVNLHNMIHMSFANNLISIVPPIFEHMARLTTLELQDNDIVSLPQNMFLGMPRLERLCLNNNVLKKLPDQWAYMPSLTYLNLGFNNISEIHDSLPSRFPNLIYLKLSGNRIQKIPLTFRRLQRLRSLHLSTNLLKTIPIRMMKSMARSLQILDLSGNYLQNSCFNALKHLEVVVRLDLSYNCISEIKQPLAPTLTHLFLISNSITKIHPAVLLAHAENLVTLALQGNRLHTIPQEIGQMRQMKLLRLANNPLREIPASITNLSALDNCLVDLGANSASIPINYDYTLSPARHEIESLNCLPTMHACHLTMYLTQEIQVLQRLRSLIDQRAELLHQTFHEHFDDLTQCTFEPPLSMSMQFSSEIPLTGSLLHTLDAGHGLGHAPAPGLAAPHLADPGVPVIHSPMAALSLASGGSSPQFGATIPGAGGAASSGLHMQHATPAPAPAPAMTPSPSGLTVPGSVAAVAAAAAAAFVPGHRRQASSLSIARGVSPAGVSRMSVSHGPPPGPAASTPRTSNASIPAGVASHTFSTNPLIQSYGNHMEQLAQLVDVMRSVSSLGPLARPVGSSTPVGDLPPPGPSPVAHPSQVSHSGDAAPGIGDAGRADSRTSLGESAASGSLTTASPPGPGMGVGLPRLSISPPAGEYAGAPGPDSATEQRPPSGGPYDGGAPGGYSHHGSGYPSLKPNSHAGAGAGVLAGQPYTTSAILEGISNSYARPDAGVPASAMTPSRKRTSGPGGTPSAAPKQHQRLRTPGDNGSMRSRSTSHIRESWQLMTGTPRSRRDRAGSQPADLAHMFQEQSR